MNRHDEAIAEIRHAQKLAPRSPVIATALANVLYLARRYDDAIAQCREALDLDAGSIAAYVVKRWALEANGMFVEALAAFEQERTFAGDTPTTRAKHAHVLAACGRTDEARKVLQTLLSRRDEHGVTSYEMAIIYALLNEHDAAFKWLAQAARQHAVGFTYAAVDPHLDNLRTDSRFRRLLIQSNIPAHNIRESDVSKTQHTVFADAATKSGNLVDDAENIKIEKVEAENNPASRTVSQHLNASSLHSMFSRGNISPDVRLSTVLMKHRPRIMFGLIVVGFVIAALRLTLMTGSLTPHTTNPVASFQVGEPSKLTTTGNAINAAVSPDGKYIAYTIEEAGRQSLWMRQASVANSVRVIQPAETHYRGLMFSLDGAYIFYVANDKDALSALYKVPAFGGSPQKVKDRVDSPVAFAPDGKGFAFVRRDTARRQDNLVIFNGKDEREVAGRTFPEHISIADAPAWSANGKHLAFAVEGSDAHGSFMKAVEVAVEDKHESTLNERRWLSIGQMAWLPGDANLVMTAQEEGSSFIQLRQLDAGQSDARKLTAEIADYFGVSLAADVSSLVTVRREMLTGIAVAPANDIAQLAQVTTGAGRYFDLSWTPGDKILYASDATGSADIWEMNADGTNQKQLTAGAKRNYAPVASPDNKQIVFHSDRSGEWQIWRMTRNDGGDTTQLTPDGGDSNWAQITPDGRFVIYERTAANAPVTVWKIPLEGGAPLQLTDKLLMRPTITPDGKSFACWQQDEAANGRWRIVIIPLEGGSATRSLGVAQGVANGVTPLRWTRDGQALMYLDYRNTTTVLWRQPLDDSPPAKLLESTGNVLIHSFGLSARNQLVISRGLMINDTYIIINANTAKHRD